MQIDKWPKAGSFFLPMVNFSFLKPPYSFISRETTTNWCPMPSLLKTVSSALLFCVASSSVFGAITAQTQLADFDDLAYAEENVAEQVRKNFTSHLFEQKTEGCPDQENWRIWVSPFVESAKQNGYRNIKGYEQNMGGFTLATDYQFDEEWAVSGGFSFANSHVDILKGRSSGTFQTYAGTIAALWDEYDFFADALFSYLYNATDAKRRTVGDSAHHDVGSNEVLGHLGGGYAFELISGSSGKFNIYPFVDLDYGYLMQDDYCERRAHSHNLKVDDKQYDLFRPEGGVGFGYGGCFETVHVTADLALSYIRELRFIGRTTHASFENGSGSLTASGLNPGNNLFSPVARISVLSKSKQASVMLGYRGEFGSRFIENELELQFKVAF